MPAKPGTPRRAGPWLAALVLGLVALFYLWTADPGMSLHPSRADQSYNNLLVRGMLKGHLSLDVPGDPFLATLKNPYDPISRAGHGLHDASYFRGKYYIYFGVTPVLILFLPYHLLTGSYLPDELAVVVFSVLGVAAGWGLFRRIVRECFPRTPAWVQAFAAAALGLATMVAPLLRRPAMWEVPISCAYALFMLTLYLLWRACAGRSALAWTAAASVAMGLTVGARPTYLLGSVVLAIPWLWRARQQGRAFRQSGEWWRMACAALGPMAAVGMGLGLYNYERFGSPLEFGITYQMAGDDVSKMRLFSLGCLLFNLRLYLFSCPGLSPYFPFLTVISPPPPPPGNIGVEDPYGIVPCMPWVLLAAAAAGLALWRRGRPGLWCAGALIGVSLTMVTTSSFAGAAGRYEVDFTPGYALIAAVGAAWVAHELDGTAWRLGALVLAALLALWSAAANVFLSLGHNRLLQLNHPQSYGRLARAFDYAPYCVARLLGTHEGPVEMRVVFPRGAEGNVEPLVATGREFLADYVYVHYLDRDHVRFGFEHTSGGSWTGPPVRVSPGQAHVVVVQMGSLFPPRESPAFDRLPPEAVESETRTVKVLVDGRVALNVKADCYDATDWQPSIGTSGAHRPGFKRDFSGRLLSWKHVAPLPPDNESALYGRVHVSLTLPTFTAQRSDPILSSGVRGRGDLLYITYLDRSHFALGHDCWGYGGSTSAPVEYTPGKPVILDISCPPLGPPGEIKRLRITCNGQAVMDVAERFNPSAPSDVAVGVNVIGASTAGISFTGDIKTLDRIRN